MATRSAYDVEDPTGLGGAASGLKTLGSIIMPDASKFAEARYYGAKTRQSAAEVAKMSNDQYAQWRLQSGLPGTGVSAFSGQIVPQMLPGSPEGTPGFPTFQPTGGPISVAPPQFVSPASGPPPSLAATVAPGPTGGPGGPGLGMPNPQATADLATHPNSPMVTGGQPPPASSPVPGAPPAPNTTTTNGQVPNNEPAVPVHPGSITDANGGPKYAPPATANGSPAPIAINTAAIVALASQAGMSAEQIKLMGGGFIDDLVRSGRLDASSGAQADAAIGQGILYQQQEATRRTLADRALIEQGAMARQQAGIRTVMGPNGVPVDMPIRDIKPGQPAYDSTLATEKQREQAAADAATVAFNRGDVAVFDENTGPQIVRRDQVNGRREMTKDEYNQATAMVEVQRRDANGNPIPYQFDRVPNWKLVQQGSGAPQRRATVAEQQGDVTQGVISAPDDEAAAAIAERGRLGVGASGTSTNAPDAKAQIGLDLVAQQTVAAMFGPKSASAPGVLSGQPLAGQPLQAEARLDATGQRVLMQRVQQLLQRNPRLAQTPGVAVQQVLAEMERNGELDVPDRSRTRMEGTLQTDTRVQTLPDPFDKNKRPKEYFIIKYRDPTAASTVAGNVAAAAKRPPQQKVGPQSRQPPTPLTSSPDVDTRPTALMGMSRRKQRPNEPLPVPAEVARQPNGTTIRDKLTGTYYVIQNGFLEPVPMPGGGQ